MIKFEKVWFKAKHHKEKKHNLVYKLYNFFIKCYFNCDIPIETQISENIYFCHNAFGVVINPNATIETGVVIQHCVTIGEIDKDKAPVIKQDVFIGARAIILGNITIGKGAKIGAGAVVLTDIPEYCTAVGVPAVIIKKESK